MNWTDKHTELQDILADLYVDKAAALRISEQAGMDIRTVTPSDNAANNWHEIIRKADSKKLLLKIIEQTLKESPKHTRLKELYDWFQTKGSYGNERESLVDKINHLFRFFRGKFRYAVVGLLIILSAAVAARFFIDPHECNQETAQKQPGMECDENEEVCTNRFDMKFQLIKAGDLKRGDQAGLKSQNAPADVRITQPFYLQITEVTQCQWISVMGKDSNFSNFKDFYQPVEMVSRNEAQDFISKLNRLEKTNSYRLPTESEWEYACKANSENHPPLGGKIEELSDYAWYDNKKTGNRTHTVSKLKHNAWFLFDMLGNVWEWVEDDWHDNYEGAPKDGTAWIDKNKGQWGVLRGGSWYDEPVQINCTSRHKTETFKRFPNAGFRCVWVGKKK